MFPGIYCAVCQLSAAHGVRLSGGLAADSEAFDHAGISGGHFFWSGHVPDGGPGGGALRFSGSWHDRASAHAVFCQPCDYGRSLCAADRGGGADGADRLERQQSGHWYDHLCLWAGSGDQSVYAVE